MSAENHQYCRNLVPNLSASRQFCCCQPLYLSDLSSRRPTIFYSVFLSPYFLPRRPLAFAYHICSRASEYIAQSLTQCALTTNKVLGCPYLLISFSSPQSIFCFSFLFIFQISNLLSIIFHSTHVSLPYIISGHILYTALSLRLSSLFRYLSSFLLHFLLGIFTLKYSKLFILSRQ